MKILITGARGLIGSALVVHFQSHGHQVVRLTRTVSAEANTFTWNPEVGAIDDQAWQEVDTVVHLAGAPIAARRWTKAVKRNIVESRVMGTRLISETLARQKQPPRVLIAASAVGYYGNRDHEVLNEESPAGTGFLADVAQQWEAATAPATDAGIRVVSLRLGVVLSAQGGALPRMVKPFRFGMGGPIGSGQQFMSWVTLEDVVSAIHYIAQREEIAGPVNVVAPCPVTQREFAQTVGRIMRRPCRVRLPSLAVRSLMGEMGPELLLSSVRAFPTRLVTAGFEFQHPELEGALHPLLSKRTGIKKQDGSKRK